jgi:hypothetical protein
VQHLVDTATAVSVLLQSLQQHSSVESRTNVSNDCEGEEGSGTVHIKEGGEGEGALAGVKVGAGWIAKVSPTGTGAGDRVIPATVVISGDMMTMMVSE